MKKIEFTLSQKAYREMKAYITSSDIKILLENPYFYFKGTEKKSSVYQELGSAIHSLILEEENFDRDFLILDKDINLRTKEGRAKKEELEKEALEKNKIILSYEIYEKAIEVKDAFKTSKIYNELFIKNKGYKEASFFNEINNQACKCRPDYFLDDKNVIIDLKTVNTLGGASRNLFLKSIINYKYYIQASFYLQITGAEKFYFLALETENPYMVGMYELDSESLKFGDIEIERALNILKDKDKFKDNVYKDYFNGNYIITELSLPSYLYNQG